MAADEKPRPPATDTCPLCHGTGWKPVEEAGVRRVVRCDCVAESRLERLWATARIPPQYQHCDFENFATNIYPQQAAYNQSLQQAKLIAERFADECPVNVDCGLLLMGAPGVGKTHLAVAILRQGVFAEDVAVRVAAGGGQVGIVGGDECGALVTVTLIDDVTNSVEHPERRFDGT